MRTTTSQASPEPGPWLERTFRGLLLCAVALFATYPMLSSGRRAVLALLGGVVLSVIALTIGWKWRQQLFFVAPEQQTRALEQHHTEMLELRAELKRLQDAMEARSVAASEASALSPCGVGLPAGVPRPSQPVPAPPGLQLGLPPAPPPAEQGGDIWAFRDFAENRRPEGPISHTGLRGIGASWAPGPGDHRGSLGSCAAAEQRGLPERRRAHCPASFLGSPGSSGTRALGGGHGLEECIAHRVQCTDYKVQSTEYRVQSAGYQVPSPENRL